MSVSRHNPPNQASLPDVLRADPTRCQAVPTDAPAGVPLSREVFEQDGVSRAEPPSGPISDHDLRWPPERKMTYWRRGALCQSLKRPLGERVKVILLAAFDTRRG
jgi:hypothetical protein